MADTQPADNTQQRDSQQDKPKSNGRDSQLSSLSQLADAQGNGNTRSFDNNRENININIFMGSNSSLYADGSLPQGLQNIGASGSNGGLDITNLNGAGQNGTAGIELGAGANAAGQNGGNPFDAAIAQVSKDLTTVENDLSNLQNLLASIGKSGGNGTDTGAPQGNTGLDSPPAMPGAPPIAGSDSGSNTAPAPSGWDSGSGAATGGGGIDNTGGGKSASGATNAGIDNTGSGTAWGGSSGGDNTGATTPTAGTDTQPAAATPAAGTDTQPAAGTDTPLTPTIGNAGIPNPGGNFQVTQNGFVGPDGQPVNMKGLNAGVQDALQGFPQVLSDYPNMTAIRLNVDPSQDSMSSIDQVIQDYTSHGIVVEAEDHSGNGSNVQWYQQMAQQYQNNPYVMLETPNEPSGDAQSVANDQINIINAIRSTGYKNPIGIQPVGGYDQSNIPIVTAAVGNQNMYVTPHIYDSSTNPGDAAQYVSSEISGAQSNGMFAWIDEFGNAMDGYTMDPQGQATIDAVIAANQSGSAGATFWGMDNGNHPDGADSAFLTPDGTQLTGTGQDLQSWI